MDWDVVKPYMPGWRDYAKYAAAAGSGAASILDSALQYATGYKYNATMPASSSRKFGSRYRFKPTYLPRRRYRKRPYGGKYKRRTRRRTRTRMRRRRRVNLRTLQRRANQGIATFIQKNRATSIAVCSINSVQYTDHTVSNIAQIEAAIDALPHYDITDPGTYIDVNYTTGGQSKDIEFASTVSCFVIKNNYQVPVKARLYLCIPRIETSIAPSTSVTNGLLDVSNALPNTTPMLSPMDSDQFKSLYRTKWTKKCILPPGGSKAFSHRHGAFHYDPSYTDTNALTNQPRNGCHIYLLRVEGVMGHQTASAVVGTAQAGVDCTLYRKYTIKYDAGATFKYIEVNDATAPTNPLMDSVDIVKEAYTVG